MAEIHEEMSELSDKQVNVQKESLKKTSAVHASSRKPTKKVCDENEMKERNKERKKERKKVEEKNDCRIKKILWK